jgi:predicted dithiol-disulfide oxidoreductase (DUF899 family)
MFFWRTFLLFAGRGSSLIFCFLRFFFQLKTKKQCAACALVRKNCDSKNLHAGGLYWKRQKDRASLVSHKAGIFAALFSFKRVELV